MLRHFIIAFVLLTALGISRAQDITFKAEASKTEVAVNERFSVRFLLSYGQTNLTIDKPLALPDFGELIPLGESNLSSFQFTNGEVQNQTGTEVMLVAEKEGEFKIGSATLTINGKRYKTEPLKITVKSRPQPMAKGGKQMQGAFLSASVSNPSPYVNQDVILEVKIFARDYSILRKLQDFREPEFRNLTVKQVSEPLEGDEKQVLVNGTTFISKVISRYVIFPQQSGEMTIDPFSLSVMLADYFGVQAVELTSPEIVMHVKKLPSGQPKNFSGAVGEFTMNTSLSKTEVKAEEAVNLEVEIIGSGNLGTFSTPAVEVPDNLEVFSPQKRDAFEARPTGMKGKVVENFVLVPHYGGDYKIDPLVFNYFNPEEERYLTLQSEAFELKVKGPQPPIVAKASDNTEPITDHVRSDSANGNYSLIPSSFDNVKEKVTEAVSERPIWYWFAGGAAALGFLLFFMLRKKKGASSLTAAADSKRRTADFNASVSSQLDELKKAAGRGDKPEFLSIQEAILTKIGMHYSGLSLSEFTETAASEKIKVQYNGVAEQWKALLLNCKQQKYAFTDGTSDLKEMFEETKAVWKAFK